MAKAKRIQRMTVTMNTGAIIKHLEQLGWLLRHNIRPIAARYPGMTNLSDAEEECVRDRIKDTVRYLEHVPGITIYDLFDDDELKAYGIY